MKNKSLLELTGTPIITMKYERIRITNKRISYCECLNKLS